MPRALLSRLCPLLVWALVLGAACGPTLDADEPGDARDAPFVLGRADGAADGLEKDVAEGVLALANDPTVTAELLDARVAEGGVGLDRRAARNIPATRPYASLAELDAVPYVGPVAFAALRRFACEVRRLCEPRLVVATWNLEQFPLAAGTVAAVAEQIPRLAADVIAVQEVADPNAFQQLVDALPEHEGLLAEPGYYTGVGLIFRRAVVRPLEVESLFTGDRRAFPRPALRLRAAVGSRVITFIVVHLKARLDEESETRRREACTKLDAYIDAHPGLEIVVLGDWNDKLQDAPTDNVFAPFLSDPEEYRFLTAPLAQEGAFSYVAFHSLIDHILVTDEVLAGRVPPQTSIPRLDLELTDYRATISDHLPVVTTLSVR